MKSDLKSFPIDVLCVVSTRNGTGNNDTNGKVGTIFIIRVVVWILEMEFEVRS